MAAKTRPLPSFLRVRDFEQQMEDMGEAWDVLRVGNDQLLQKLIGILFRSLPRSRAKEVLAAGNEWLYSRAEADALLEGLPSRRRQKTERRR